MERSVSQPDQQKHLEKKKEVDDKSQDGKLQVGQGSTDEGTFTLSVLLSALTSQVQLVYCRGDKQMCIAQIFTVEQ